MAAMRKIVRVLEGDNLELEAAYIKYQLEARNAMALFLKLGDLEARNQMAKIYQYFGDKRSELLNHQTVEKTMEFVSGEWVPAQFTGIAPKDEEDPGSGLSHYL
jgi:hypothetical protein